MVGVSIGVWTHAMRIWWCQPNVAWCRVQQYGVLVLDDMATVDLDWWNDRLTKHAIPVRLTGRDPDGAITDRGVAVITRGDLTADPAGGGLGEVRVLYAAAAWLSGHRDRDRLRRFLDVRTTSSRAEHRFEMITKALAACRQPHLLSIPQIAASNRRWSGWPRTPGVGAAVMSLYCWATHHDTAEPTEVRPQLTRSTGGGIADSSGMGGQPSGGAVHLGALHPLLRTAARLGRPSQGTRRADRDVAGHTVARTRHTAYPTPTNSTGNNNPKVGLRWPGSSARAGTGRPVIVLQWTTMPSSSSQLV